MMTTARTINPARFTIKRDPCRCDEHPESWVEDPDFGGTIWIPEVDNAVLCEHADGSFDVMVLDRGAFLGAVEDPNTILYIDEVTEIPMDEEETRQWIYRAYGEYMYYLRIRGDEMEEEFDALFDFGRGRYTGPIPFSA